MVTPAKYRLLAVRRALSIAGGRFESSSTKVGPSEKTAYIGGLL